MFSDRVTASGIRNAVIWAGLSIAFLLSVSLAVGLCTEACKATYNWTIFRMKFPYLGIGFFAFCLLLFYFRGHDPLRFLFHVAIAGAWGAEITFIYAQHSLIKRWCPLCLAVAFCVYAVGIALAAGWIARVRKRVEPGRGEMMRHLTKGVVLAAALFAGAYVSFLGLGNPESSHAATLSAALGKQDSDVEVYVFTDWFCPACRQAEPEMEKAYPNIMKRAKLLFIDDPIHPESMNFIPYNLSFLVREKGKYLEIRKALLALAERTKEPTPEDVQKAVAKLGVAYRPLNYSDVNAGIQYFQSMAKAFRVEGTPSIVVYNRKTKSYKLLTGVRDLSAPNILMAVSGVAPP
ncbi:MAG TPA: thioredoxin domain-containing protein [Candidatus Deferrimicrobiaceae bacterium]|nr:thioredoxin domain-containing protein [Candidatus Deferrimicrobiaceae bacterium]